MDGIFGKTEEMGRAVAIGTAKALYTPVCHGIDGPGQVVLQVIRRPDGQGGDDVGFLAQVVDVPVHLLAFAAVAGQTGSQVSSGPTRYRRNSRRKRELPFRADGDILRICQMKDE